MRMSPADRVLVHGVTLLALPVAVSPDIPDHWEGLALSCLRDALPDVNRGLPELAALAAAGERLVRSRPPRAIVARGAALPVADWHRRCLAAAFEALRS